MLTLVMAHSVAMGIRETTGLEAFIKWPNDVVVNRKKVCGILTEMSAEVDYIHHILIGLSLIHICSSQYLYRTTNLAEFPLIFCTI